MEQYIDGQNVHYLPGSFLTPGVGNNAFSFARKKDRRDLWITPLRKALLSELRVGSNIVFQDFDGEEWGESVGLHSALYTEEYGVPLYVFDNHNHVFFAWAEQLMLGTFYRGAQLVHMDEHFDDTEPPSYDVDLSDLSDVFRYTNDVLQIATYIRPALELGIFSSCLNFVESSDFSHLPNRPIAFPSGDCVINLDMDLFHPDMNHIPYDQKIRALKAFLPSCRLMTIATSPYFMDQQVALSLLHQIFSELF